MSMGDIVRRGALLASRWVGDGAGRPAGALILAFRRPGRAAEAISILDALHDEGCRTVTLPRLGRDLARGRPVAGVVCPTFDGDLACWAPAVERLLERGERATVFALGAGVSGQPGLPTEVEGPLAGRPRVGLDTLAGWAEQGAAVGTLGMTGVLLPGLSKRRLRVEMFDSRRVLVEALGRPVECLAYPDGAVTRTVAHMAASVGYRWACTDEQGYAAAQDYPLLLPRLEAAGARGALDLARGVGGTVSSALSHVRRLQQRRMMRG